MDEALNMDAAYEGVRRLGLKEGNTAADRAKAMGFDGVEYHTTTAENAENIVNNNFKNFMRDRNFSNLGSNYGSPRSYYAGQGTYTSNDPFSSEFTAQAGIGGIDNMAMFPLMINKSKQFDYKNSDHLKSLIAKRNEKERILDDKLGFGSGEVDPRDLEALKKGSHHVMEDYRTIMNMKKRGFTGTNLKEPVSYLDNAGVTTNTFNPQNIRSIFAKFNPKYAGVGTGSIMSADLLANEANQPTSLLGYDPQTMEPLFAPPEQSHLTLDNLKSLDKEFLKKLAEGTYDFGKEIVLSPDVIGEVVGTGLLKGMGVASPYIKGMGIGGLLMPSDILASQKFYNEDDLERLRNR